MPEVQRVSAAVGGASRTSGFVLVVTLVVVASLGVLLGALTVYARIETAVADQTVARAQARQNARVALALALGRLQETAGPDTRVTTSAEAWTGTTATQRYTGVWDSAESGITPLTWLVSGAQTGAMEELDLRNRTTIELVGANSTSASGGTLAPLQPIEAAWPLGSAERRTIGRLAWWVGDEGVKASVALSGDISGVTYAPFDSDEARRRVRQQLALGAGPSDAAGNLVFEPRTLENQPLLSKVWMLEQLAWMKSAAGAVPAGREPVRASFDSWTVNHRAVLADPRRGGLRRDLSLKPECLGDSFAAWAQYSTYAQPMGATGASLRHRCLMTPPRTSAGVTHGITPVLSYLLLTFNVRTDQSVSGSTRPLEVRARWLVSLWNPFTSALVPEDLQLEVENLPSVQVIDDTGGTGSAVVALDALYGSPLRISLPWVADVRPDRQTWLPGRVHTWASGEDLNKQGSPPAAGFGSVFYTRTLSSAAGQGVQRAMPGTALANSAMAHLAGNSTQLQLRLYRVGSTAGRELLRTFLSPTFSAFVTTPAPISAATYQVTYLFHLAESTDTPGAPDIWLGTLGQDPRESTVPSTAYSPGANGPRPELYPNYTAIAFPDRLLDRALPASASSSTGQSYNEDTPVFELPRQPMLSVGALQHLPVAGARPFAIGNSWGAADHWNACFDRYFFSGLTPEVSTAMGASETRMPNPFLRLVDSATRVDELLAEAATGYSSMFLLQAGAFNMNSTNETAWLSVLRSGRMDPDAGFTYLNASASTGTADDIAVVAPMMSATAFYRFPMSAQETYKADAGYAASTTVPPVAPNAPAAANTHLYRRGVRSLTAAQTLTLAQAVARLVRERLVSVGPFRSVEEFLAPVAEFGGHNLLEQAIALTNLNDPAVVPEFCSQWLTSGDVMSGLAPVLAARSDTFRVRVYGEVLNPATGETTGRAWAEAMVQRFPGYLDDRQEAASLPAELNSTNRRFGRRFRMVSFRWLQNSDL